MNCPICNTKLEEYNVEFVCENLNRCALASRPLEMHEWLSIHAAIAAAHEAGQREMQRSAALKCSVIAHDPSSLWEEPGCWKHAANNCRDAILAMPITKDGGR